MNTLRRFVVLLLGLVAAGAAFAQFDHGYAGWDALVVKHVKWLADNKQSRVDYAAFQADRAALKKVLASFSAVTRNEFEGWSKPQQMAFLINAYNAFTVELILTKYPDLKSIKDLGSFLQSPWKKKFFRLLGEERTLDWIEHEQLRPNYADPRVHAAVNCASIGCPALRDEAFTAAKLEAQLDDGMQRFMGDRTRNRVRDRAARGELDLQVVPRGLREGPQGFRQARGCVREVRRTADRRARRAGAAAGRCAVAGFPRLRLVAQRRRALRRSVVT